MISGERKQRVLVTGTAGFVASYLVPELLARGYEVVGVDNLSRYGPGSRPAIRHTNFSFVRLDAKRTTSLRPLLAACDHFVALAAMVGGVSYLNRFSYDLFSENTRLSTAAVDAAVWAHHHGRLARITVISSSHVYGETSVRGAREGDERRRCPPTSYGLQKLTFELMAKEAHRQHDLPFTIVRPFNCVGREARGRDHRYGRHVIPDLIRKIRDSRAPLQILGNGRQRRSYIHGSDLARGIASCLNSPHAENEDFNLTSPDRLSVLEIAGLIWRRLRGGALRYRLCDGPTADLQVNVGDGEKAATRLGFQCRMSIDDVLEEMLAAAAGAETHGGRHGLGRPAVAL
jgi:UDP-glucose 4-epimerase